MLCPYDSFTGQILLRTATRVMVQIGEAPESLDHAKLHVHERARLMHPL